MNYNTQQFTSGPSVEYTKITNPDGPLTETSIKMLQDSENEDCGPKKRSVFAGLFSRLLRTNTALLEGAEDSFLAGMLLAFVVLSIAAFIALTVS